MFGRYEGEFSRSSQEVSLSVTKAGPLRWYERVCGSSRTEKVLPEREGTVVINPVEPVNLPAPLAHHLEISFPAIVLPPKTSRRLFLSFPLEVGVFLDMGNEIHVLDIFSHTTAKYSLYGQPDSGLITRWHRSELFLAAPEIDNLRAGILDLTLRNSSAGAVDVARFVIDSRSMHLWYGNHVAMAADMEVFSPAIARITVSENPPAEGMQRSIELYLARKIPSVHGRGFLMEYGVA